MWNKFQSKHRRAAAASQRRPSVASTALRELPSKADRLALYRRVEHAVDGRCQLLSTLLDPRTLGIKGLLSSSKSSKAVTEIGIRQRQVEHYRLEFLPTVSAALLLEIQDVLEDHDEKMMAAGGEALALSTTTTTTTTLDIEDNDTEISPNSSATCEQPLENERSNNSPASTTTTNKNVMEEEELIQRPMATMALLVSNLVLVSGGNYDARTRSILKQVCVEVLLACQQKEQSNETKNETNTKNAIAGGYDPETDPHRALYFLTEQHVEKKDPTKADNLEKSSTPKRNKNKKNNKVITSPDPVPTSAEDLFSQTSQIPKLAPARIATMQFEALERAVATDILRVMVERDAQQKQQMASSTKVKGSKFKFKDAVVRGLQITTVGVVVGSLFAVTGGLAAPGLVAAITAFGVHSSVMFATLTTTTALASMFGVVGGGLGAYKMSKRVKGLTEWKIRQETVASNRPTGRRNKNSPKNNNNKKDSPTRSNSGNSTVAAVAADATAASTSSSSSTDQITLRGLHAHVCVSGWLAEASDFQVPFGVQPNDPPVDRLTALQRFFTVHGPDKVQHAKALLKANKGEEDELWFELAGRYGRSPDHLLPFATSTSSAAGTSSAAAAAATTADDNNDDDDNNNTSNNKAVLSPETESEIYSVLLQHVLSEESAEKMKQIWETSTMLVQMEAKNHEVLTSNASFASLTSGADNGVAGASSADASEQEGSSGDDTNNDDEMMEERMQGMDGFLDEQDEEQMRRLKEEALMIERLFKETGSTTTASSTLEEKQAAGTTNGDNGTNGQEVDVVVAAAAATAEKNVSTKESPSPSPSPPDDHESSITEPSPKEGQYMGDSTGGGAGNAIHATSQSQQAEGSHADDEAVLDKQKTGGEERLVTPSPPVHNGDDGKTTESSDDGVDEKLDGQNNTATENNKDRDGHDDGPSAASLEVGSSEKNAGTISDSPQTSEKANTVGADNQGETPSAEEVERRQSKNDGTEDATSSNETSSSEDESDDRGDHLQIIWDWQATYQGEMYTVTWETDFLLKLCRVATVLFLELSDQVGKQLLTNALVGGAVMLPSALLTASGVIDDPYQIITLRSKKAGIELAHCLMTSEEHRPISLVGFSFGARVIFDCLLELAKHQLKWQERRDAERDGGGGMEDDTSRRGRRKSKSSSSDRIEYIREPASIVEDVVLIGMPRTIDTEHWISCREIVGGRLVNCYNRKDWIVAYMIKVRCAGGIRKTCGTHPIENIEGVENYEVSDFASTHDRYRVAVPQILHKVGYSQPRAASAT